MEEVLDTGVLMRYGFDGMRKGRWKAREFEKALADRMQVQHAQLVSSGTAALSVALACAGIGSGDEVILPTFTFVATFEAVLAQGAIPVLADIDDSLTLDPASVEKLITSRTRAVIPVHMCGSMGDLGELKRLCANHGLIMIEDACQALGGSYEGKPLGSYGDLGCFSFDFVKTITCGEGGAILTNHEEYSILADQYSDHGHDHSGSDRGAEGHPILGYNFRISELHAAVGLAQLRRLDEFLAIQELNYKVFSQTLQDLPGITFRRIPDSGVPNYSFLSFFLPDENLAQEAHRALSKTGMDGCFYWYENNWHYHRRWNHLKKATSAGPLAPALKYALKRMGRQEFRQSDHWMGRNISCLIRLGWSEQQVSERAATMAEILQKYS